MKRESLFKSSIILSIFWFTTLAIYHLSEWMKGLWTMYIDMVKTGVGVIDSFRLVYLGNSVVKSQLSVSAEYIFYGLFVGGALGTAIFIITKFGQKILLLIRSGKRNGIGIYLKGTPIGVKLTKSPYELNTTPQDDFVIDVKDSIVVALGGVPSNGSKECPQEDLNSTSDKRQNEQEETLYLSLFTEIAIALHNYPDAFVGDGHQGVTLYEHSLATVNALDDDINDPLLPIITLAHDIGKILSHEKNKHGEWVKKGNHDDLSALIVAQMKSYEKLGPDEQTLIETALRYSHKKHLAPELREDLQERFDKLFAESKEADVETTKEEKRKKLEDYTQEEIYELLYDAFIEGIKDALYNTPESPRNQASTIYRVKRRLYILYKGFLEELLQNLDPDLKALIAPKNLKNKKLVDAFSNELFAALEYKKILLTQYKDMKTVAPLWEIRSESDNKKFTVFTNVLIVDLPKELLEFTGGETGYSITIVQPIGYNKKQSTLPPVPAKEITYLAKLYMANHGGTMRNVSQYLKELHDNDRKEFDRIRAELESTKPVNRKINKSLFTKNELKKAREIAKKEGISEDSALHKIWKEKLTEQQKEHEAVTEKKPKQVDPKELEESKKRQKQANQKKAPQQKQAQEKKKRERQKAQVQKKRQSLEAQLFEHPYIVSQAKAISELENLPFDDVLKVVVTEEKERIESEAKKMSIHMTWNYDKALNKVLDSLGKS